MGKIKEVKSIEMEVDGDDIDKVFSEGVSCCAVVEVGEVVDCLLTMFEHIQGTNMVQGFKQAIGLENSDNVDKFLMLLLVSEVATLTGNFKKREEQEETAKA